MNRVGRLVHDISAARYVRGARVFLWDIDGTLYRSREAGIALRSAFVSIVAQSGRMTGDRAEADFARHASRTHSTWSQTVHALTGIDERQAILQAEAAADKTRYIRQDRALIELFSKFSRMGKIHCIVSNNSGKQIRRVLKQLGLTPSVITFSHVFCLDAFQNPKPHPSWFTAVFRKTGIPPRAHIMIGDSMTADIVPARQAGIRTCLVSAGYQRGADICIDDVYQIGKYL